MEQAINCFIYLNPAKSQKDFQVLAQHQNAHLHSTDKSLEFMLKNMYQKSASRQLKKHQKRM